MLRRLVFLSLLGSLTCLTADLPLVPQTVCELLRDPQAQEGKNVAAMGRYSFRESGRYLSEDACDPPVEAPPKLWLVEDTKDGPKPPGNFEIDAVALNKKFAEVQRHAPLEKFRFGTPDYDRWAVVFGKLEQRKGDDAKKAPENLVFRGSGVVVFLTPDR